MVPAATNGLWRHRATKNVLDGQTFNRVLRSLVSAMVTSIADPIGLVIKVPPMVLLHQMLNKRARDHTHALVVITAAPGVVVLPVVAEGVKHIVNRTGSNSMMAAMKIDRTMRGVRTKAHCHTAMKQIFGRSSDRCPQAKSRYSAHDFTKSN